MKTILVIADNTAEAAHAAACALMIAQAVGANIIIGNTMRVRQREKGQPVLNGADAAGPGQDPLNAKQLMESKMDSDGTYIPAISEIDISDFEKADLAGLINNKNIWLLVEGMPETISTSGSISKVNARSVLNRVHCPLLLVPQSWKLKLLERIVYIADLRYCKLPVLKFLASVAAPFDASISIAHLSAKGLVHVVDSYADTIFRDEIMPNVHYDKISLNNTRERDINKAVDVLINSMHNDLLVLVNDRYHFQEIIGRNIGNVLPPEITVPVLVFPL